MTKRKVVTTTPGCRINIQNRYNILSKIASLKILGGMQSDKQQESVVYDGKGSANRGYS